jgi:CRISPR-associated exonuclease Cas4
MSLLDTPHSLDTTTDAPDAWWVRVTDLKQYAYCPRVTYYMYCLPNLRPKTYKMQAGIESQGRVTELEERRSLQAYGLSSGERHFHVPVRSTALGCVGQIDMVIETQEGGKRRLIPVDYKLSRRTPGRHFQLQVACYGMMLEEMYGVPVTEGFLYLIQSRKAERVAITKRLRREATLGIAAIRAMILSQQMPPATAHRGQCVACEYRRFCNDVL